MTDEKPVMHEIRDVVQEARDTRSFWFSGRPGAKPGQFVMLWIPGSGQKPFGVSYQEKEGFALTVRKVGPFTRELFRMKKGDRLGIQGPYGRGFSMKGKKAVIVGGGYGTAPLGFLAGELLKKRAEVTFITGAATKDFLLFRKRYRDKKIRMVFSTDDGSLGRKGLCTDCLEEHLSKGKTDIVYCCGPEIMMKKVFAMCRERKVPAEFSLERYMKCGFGICGSCCLDPTGWRVCKEGPVFPLDELKKVSEFGEYTRDASGRKVRI
jgi:dihydroorotate dehydrogenase electron transfer subunit